MFEIGAEFAGVGVAGGGTLEMAKLAITAEDEVLRQARIRALAPGKSVNAILAGYLRSYADLRAAQEDATRTLIRLLRKSKSELHER